VPGPVTPPPADTTPLPPVEHRGIAFGPFHVPPDLYGPEFTGTVRTTSPARVMADLQAARRAGARVLLGMVGWRWGLHGPDGHFSMDKWKQRVDRYRAFDLAPYIADGTIIGHFIMDEPHDKTNWGGTQVTVAEIEEMAKYSKQIWPDMATVIRAWPDYLRGYSFKYLDAQWAQYSPGVGPRRYRVPIDDFIRDNIRGSAASGLRLVVGLNVLAGSDDKGLKGYYYEGLSMTASQVKSWGSALLAEPNICAFLTWKYNKEYFERADIKEALAELGEKASDLPKRSCHR
jgi:hypothetical protein